MSKYILQLLLPLFGFGGANTQQPTPADKQIMNPNVVRIQAIIARKAAAREAAQAKKSNTQPTTSPAVLLPTLVPTHKPVEAPKPIVAANPAPKASANSTASKVSLSQILDELDRYVDCAFACVKNFLSPQDTRKLPCFAKEIDACVKNLDEKVLKPLESLKNNDPIAAHVYQMASVLKHNQEEFKRKITGGYKNAMSLGMALMNLKNKAVRDVNKTLEKVAPSLHISYGTQFAPIKKKIVALTNYGTNPMTAMKVLGNRF